MRSEQLLGGPPLERWPAREHLIGDDAERVQVRPVVDRVAGGLLRREIGGRPERRPELGERGRACAVTAGGAVAVARGANRLGDAEVGDHGAAFGAEDVAGLDVAVHHAMPVRVRKRTRDVAQKRDRVGHRECAFARESAGQGFALDEGHAVEQRAARQGAGCQERDDVRVLQPRCQPNLTPEPFDAHRIPQVRGEHFDDHAPAECDLLGDEHAAHAAAAEFALEDVVVAEIRVLRLCPARHAHVVAPI